MVRPVVLSGERRRRASDPGVSVALRFDGDVFLFEFKVAEQAGEGSAMAQLKSRGYAEKYLGTSTPVHLIGVEFSSETRNIAAFEVEHEGESQ